MPSPPSLQAPRPLNCMLAGYFSRVMGSLLLRRTQDIMQYLQKHQELLLQVIAVRACTRPFPQPFTPIRLWELRLAKLCQTSHVGPCSLTLFVT